MKIKRDAKKRSAGNIVLIADDTAAIRNKVVAAFDAAGFGKCVEAENGQQAIAAAKRIKPNLIILDLSMPVMNGLEAASKLRKIFPKTPIILFGFYADILSKTSAAKSGVSLLLSKAVPLPKLVAKARKLMGK